MQKFADIIYVRPDLTAYKDSMPSYIDAVAGAMSFDALKKLWMEHSVKQSEVMTMRTVASIRNTVDTTDPFYEEEMRYFNSELPAISILEAKAEAALLNGKFASDFEQAFGSVSIADMKNSQLFADERIVPLKIRESDLVQQYFKVSATASTELRGKTVNFYGLLKGMQSTDRTLRADAFIAWADLYASIAPELDRIYDGLIALRTEMAHILGFKNHTEMAYLQRHRYDYKAEDVERFHKEVKRVITPICVKLFEEQRKRLGVDKIHWYDESLVFPEGNAAPEGTTKELLQKAQEMYAELSPETKEFFDFMRTYDLFDLESKPGKRPGGYCTSMPSFKAPFIFSNFNGTSADAGVLTHEAGHAFQAYLSSRVQPLLSMAHSTSEINEIHSMAMELFTYPWMDKFFGKHTTKYLYEHTWDAVNKIPYMCCVDDFQHHVYDNPEMSASERRAVWRRLEKEYMPWRDYDGNEFLESGGFWMQKQHIFMAPFYYIEYALAQVCSFQFLGLMQKDKDAAWTDYLTLCRAGGSLGYYDLLRLAHLENPFEDGTVEHAVSDVLNIIEEYGSKL